jgi:iron complex outermembrane receptor protein
MSLEELLNIQITTVSRLPEQTMRVPAAVYVITSEDIRRSGATSIPEALRLAPGLQVARITGGTWAVGVRGFADRLARSILVLIDGRAVYSPLFAGTYWETQDTLLEDIDRIEVIRGPGGTLWGANAVNGIVNIITKSANDTQGLYVNGGGGSEERGLGAVRFGAASGRFRYRGYFKALDRGPEFHSDGNEYDGWRVAQGGFRGDWALRNDRTMTVQGDVYDGRLGERPSVASYTSPFTSASNIRAPLSGGDVLARIANNPAGASSYQLQAYYDHTSRDEIPVGEDRHTVDVDFQHAWRGWKNHVITSGAGYRVTSGRITAVAPTVFTPTTRTAGD